MATGCARLIKRPSAMPYSPPLAHAPSGSAAAVSRGGLRLVRVTVISKCGQAESMRRAINASKFSAHLSARGLLTIHEEPNVGRCDHAWAAYLALRSTLRGQPGVGRVNGRGPHPLLEECRAHQEDQGERDDRQAARGRRALVACF
mgnify:CR=1 FL=1